MRIKLSIDKTVTNGENNVVLTVNANTVGESLSNIVEQQPALKKLLFEENGGLRYGNVVKVNEDFILAEPLAKPVKDGDEIGVINICGG